MEVARDPLAHRDHEALGHEHGDLAEVDLLAVVVVARRAQHDEQDPLVVLVLLDLRAQVEALGVLHREVVQPEAPLDQLELLLARLDDPEPHEPAALLGHTDAGRLVELHRAFVLPPTVAIVRAVDDHTAKGTLTAMCRNIRPLYNFEPPATEDEVHAAALQYVRKISGFTKPSQANQEAFDRAVHEVAHASRHLLEALQTAAPPKDREVEAAKARARAAQRYAA